MTTSHSRLSDPALRLSRWSAGGSAALLVVLAGVSYTSGSMLAFAQAADSLADTLTAILLLLAVRVSTAAPDDEHPFGHHGAQPIAALIVAVLAGVLAIEVMRAAIAGLAGATAPRLGWPVAAAFFAKLTAKAAMFVAASRQQRRHSSPVVRALAVDALNDVAVSSVAVVGFLAARYGHAAVDAWLAIPVAGWIGWAGMRLALDNIRLLMGEAPAEGRQRELCAALAAVPGVLGVVDFRARYHGTSIVVRATVTVDATLTVRQACTIGDRAEGALLDREDVSDAAVKIDVG